MTFLLQEMKKRHGGACIRRFAAHPEPSALPPAV